MFVPRKFLEETFKRLSDAECRVAVAKDEALQQIKTVLSDQLLASRKFHSDLTEQHKIVLAATLSQNSAMLDRIMAMAGRLTEYEMSRGAEIDILKDREKVEEKERVQDDLEKELASALNDMETKRQEAEEAELVSQIRTGKLRSDL